MIIRLLILDQFWFDWNGTLELKSRAHILAGFRPTARESTEDK